MVRPELPGAYSRLVCSDGSVLVPADVADGMLRLLVLGVMQESQRNAGGRPSAKVVGLLHALNAAAVKHEEALSVKGLHIHERSSMDIQGESWKTSAEAASLLQCTERSVRRACEQGRLSARKLGRQWLISPEALKDYRFGKPT